jgi:outer membrane protein OmpA-like peptidoglycan-associated protein
MKKLFSMLIFFSFISFAQQNPFAGKFSPSIDGLINLSYTDYVTSITRFGFKFYGDYYIPMKGYAAVGIRLSAMGYQLGGEDPDKYPDRFRTDLYGPGIGITFLHSQENFFFKSIYAGISYMWFDPMIEAGRISPNNARNAYQKSSLVYDLAFGLKFLVSESFAINTSLGLHFFPNDNIDDYSAGQHNDVYSSISAGVSFILGSHRDKDRDGIPDYKDECPDAPEDYDGFEDEDGCPDPDNDGDGIPDHLDKCPDLAEDFDGFEDEDGCPDLDNDKDGIPDDQDECPDEPEDFDGYLDRDGCPDLDNDNDGIPDSEDKCPNEAEDYDGFEDTDGCPDLDNDGDGIPDTEDKCPDMAEDFDGFEDEDGCPDLDNDGDGIPDVFDKCPDEKETYNGYMDDDGCPDEVPAKVKKEEVKQSEPLKKEPPKVVIPDEFLLDGIQTFIDDDYEIKSSAHPELDRIVELIRRDSTSRWRIEGHTDDFRPENENLKISQQRATEVLLYFVKKGLRYPRFEAVGYGSKYPIYDNSKPSGRSKNRRVVIKKIR